MSKILRIILSIIATGFICAASQAEDVVAPPNTDPGAVLFDIREKQKPRKYEKEEGTNLELDIKNLEQEKDPEKIPELKFFLEKVEFSGNSIISDKELKNLSQKYEQKFSTFKDIRNLTIEVTDLYKEKGYLTSIAYIPPQKIGDGVVKINIAEGKIGNIDITGNRWTRKRFIEKNLLESNNFAEKQIFNVNNLKDSVQEINSKSYLKGNVTLEKGEKEGTTDILFEIEDEFPLRVGASWNNYGREFIGKQRAGINTTIENFTGYGDRLTVFNTLAHGTYGLNTIYSIPVNIIGTRLNLGYSVSRIEMGGSFKPNNIQGNSQGFSAEITHPLFKKNIYELNSFFGFDFLHSKTTILGQTVLSNYDTRVLRYGINGYRYGTSGVWLGEFSVSNGLPILGATVHRSSQLPDGNFVKLNSHLTRYQNLPWGIIGIFRGLVQYSPMTLLSSEQFYLGGGTTVRGFSESALYGDYGYNLSAEILTPIPFLPREIKVPFQRDSTQVIPLKNDLKFVAFYDQGWTHLIHQGTNPTYKNFIQSVGVGLRYNLGRFINFGINFGFPLGRERFEDQDNFRVHFALESNLI